MMNSQKLREMFGDLVPSNLSDSQFKALVERVMPQHAEVFEEATRTESDFLAVLRAVVKAGDKGRSSRQAFVHVDEGYVCGEVTVGKRTISVDIFVDFETGRVGGECECQSDSVCEHAADFAAYLIDEFEQSESSVRDRVVEELRLTEDVDRNRGPLAIRALDQLIRYAEQKTEQETETQEVTRVLWRIEVDESRQSLSLTPVLQKQKKRGGGWTKGRALRPENMLQNSNLTLTSVDSKVLQARSREYGYYGGYAWDLIAALNTLVGYEHVAIDDEPAIVCRQQFGIRVDKNRNLYSLRLDAPEPTFNFETGFVAIDKKNHCVFVCECDETESRAAELFEDGNLAVHENEVSDLKNRLKSLSKLVSVRQPKEFAGEIVPAEWQPVLKLLSTKDGQLQCGIRARVNEQLYPPGAGLKLLPGKASRKKVQFERDLKEEQLSCRRLAGHLTLDTASKVGDWDWRFVDFEESLAFLALMESKTDELGIDALWDEESVQALRMVGAITAQNVRVEVNRKKDWFGLEGGFAIGDHEFSLPELLAAVDNEPAKGYTELRPGMWAKITDRLRNRLRELRDVAHKNRSNLEVDVTAIPVVQSLLESELDIKASHEWQDRVQRLEGAMKLRPKPSKKLKADLRDYQQEGYRWMRRLAEWGVGGILADDMGLGKTVQTLAVLLDRTKKGPALVIAPTSVGFNWQRETEKFTPSLKAHLYRETDRAEFLDGVKKNDVVVCSYGLALRDVEALSKVEWGTLVLDEAQFIKNSRSKTSQAIRLIPADWKLALTGTPMENHLGELWSIFRTVSPGLLGSWDQFRKRFAGPIEKEDDPERRKSLSKLIQPFVLRRTKSEVLKDLPERTEINLHVDLSDDERKRYDEMRLAAVGELDEIVGLPSTNDQRFRVLAILTRLRQMACHIGLVDESFEGESAKLNLLVEKVNELKEEGHRVLIFSQFTKYLELIRNTLESNSVTYEYLDGKTPAKRRQERVDRFQEGNTDAFLISLKAGGTGLNLTAADYVIHMDPWWNPAVEDQATDRSHRIGQTKPVIVYRILATGTVEEQILSLHADKRDLVAGIMEGTQKAGKLSTNQLLDLIRQT